MQYRATGAVRGASADVARRFCRRIGKVNFSQVYMWVQQGFLVLDESNIRAVTDVDQVAHKIAGTRKDSITLFMKRNFRNATVIEEGYPASCGAPSRAVA